MAFTTRSSRNTDILGHYQHMTDPVVGPATYVGHGASDGRANYSAFNSTQEKFKSGSAPSASAAVGPGQYLGNNAKVPSGGNLNKSSGAGAAFRSEYKRLGPTLVGGSVFGESTIRSNPGPGAYTSTATAAGDLNSVTTRSKNKKPMKGAAQPTFFVRSSNPPSIPAPSQSYGYEDGTNGELVPQGAPQKGHTGKKSGLGASSVGPSCYEPSHTMGLPNAPEVDFGKSSTSRTAFAPQKNMNVVTPGSVFAQSYPMGPGTYNPQPAPGTKEVFSSKMSSNFASRVPMGHQYAKKEAKPQPVQPGPGAYQTSIQSMDTTTHSRAQVMGSTEKRGYEVDTQTSFLAKDNERTPGPGSYKGSYGRSDFKNAGGVLRGSSKGPRGQPQGGSRAGFSSSVNRLAEQKGGSWTYQSIAGSMKNKPAPGSYDRHDRTLVGELERRTIGRHGVFGTTTRRFKDDKEGPPGPGQYSGSKGMSDPSSPSNSEAYGFSRVNDDTRTGGFASGVQRFSSQASLHGPPKPSTGALSAPSSPPAGGLGGDASLVENLRALRQPPPVGAYNVRHPADAAWNKPVKVKPHHPRAASTFGSSTDRFPEGVQFGSKISENPPPGYYKPSTEQMIGNEMKPTAQTPHFATQESRFKENAGSFRLDVNNTPGAVAPGAYQAEAPELMKRTYNVTIAGSTF